MKLTIRGLTFRTIKRDVNIKERVKFSKVTGTRSRKNVRRFIFHVKSSMHYSDKKGHLVSYVFPKLDINEVKKDPKMFVIDQRVQLHCTCPAFQMWGSAYWSTHYNYNITQFKENRAPNVRDPHAKRFICKHIYCVNRDIWNDTFVRIYNRFNRAFYRKKEKQRIEKNLKRRKQSNENGLPILRFLYQYLLDTEKLTQQEAVEFINYLIKEDTIEDFLEAKGLIIS